MPLFKVQPKKDKTNSPFFLFYLQHTEIWLTGLVSLSAEIVRMGVRDLFSSFPSADRFRDRPDCYWAGRGAVWGVGRGEEGWVQRIKNTTICDI